MTTHFLPICYKIKTLANWQKVGGHIFKFWIWWLWLYGFWSFQTGVTKLERFLPKNQHTQRKLLNFEFWIDGKLSKSAKI